MANRFARKNGNWDASDVWSDTPSGSASASFIPTTGDVAMANSFTVTVNVNADLGSTGQARNDTTGGATAGGLFDLAAGVTLTANVYGGGSSTQCVRFALAAPNVAYVVGAVFGGTAAAGYGAINTSTGTLSITGDVTGGAGSGSTAHGINNSSTGIVTISGSVTGGSAGAGVNNASTGTVTVGGSAIGGSGSSTYGALNGSTGTLTLNGAAYGSSTSTAPGLFGSTGAGFTYAKGAGYVSATGCMPYGGHIRFDFTANSKLYVRDQNLVERTYIPAEYSVANGIPAITNVRHGTSYALGALTGTAYIPAASSVVAGVPVDATVGTANLLTAADVRAAIGLASANLDTQLADLPTAAENATAVWGAESRTLTSSSGLTAQQVWEYATRTLTAGSGITAQDVWEYATRELTSSAGGASAEDIWTYETRSLTEAPDVPTVEEIAAEVRTELTPELSRVANCATVESTGDQLEALL